MATYRVDFCTHLARAIRKGQKTVTYKPLTPDEVALHTKAMPVPCPYGQAGDTLWVRESWGTLPNKTIAFEADYAGDGQGAVLKLPVGFIPGNASLTQQQARSILTVKSIDIINLHTITEADAQAAGTLPTHRRTKHLDEFVAQWNAAYPRWPFSSGPLVWKIAFTVNA
jgi:hypothetical protein